MKLEEMPGCCTARVLFDFGGSRHAMHRRYKVTAEELEVEYKKATEAYDIFVDEDEFTEDCWNFGAAAGNAVMVACTTTEQAVANEFLQSKGFLRAGPYKKPKHPETGLYLWWLPLFGVYGEEG